MEELQLQFGLDKPVQQRRNKKSLTLAERISVIQMYETTPNTRYLAKIFECGRTQIQNILRHRSEYLDDWSNNADPTRVRRRQSARLMSVGAIVHEWVQRCQNYPIIITDEILRDKGNEVAVILDVREFHPTNRWLERFKKKYKLDLAVFNNQHNKNIDTSLQKSLDMESIIDSIKDGTNGEIPLLNEFEMHSLNYNDTNQPKDYMELSGKGNEMDDIIDLMSDNYCSDSNSSSKNNWSKSFGCTSGGSGDSSSKCESDVIMDQISASKSNIKEIKSYREALNLLGPLEQFALGKENIRAIGLINQIENIFREEMLKLPPFNTVLESNC